MCRYLAFFAVIIIEGCSVCLTPLRVFCGDAELDPGPRNTLQDNRVALLSKLSKEQTTILENLSGMEEKMHQIEQRLGEAEERVRELSSKKISRKAFEALMH